MCSKFGGPRSDIRGKAADVLWYSTTSGLALIPLVRCSNYSASKAALHHFILCLREQLKSSPQIKVVELFPPAVQSKWPYFFAFPILPLSHHSPGFFLLGFFHGVHGKVGVLQSPARLTIG